MKINMIQSITVIALVCMSSVYADVFTDLRYTFSGGSVSALGGSSRGDLTASDITTSDSGSMGGSSSGNNFYFTGSANTTVTEPVNYLTWTLTVSAGSQLELTKVNFDYYSEHPGDNDGVSFALRSSLDGFTANIAAVVNYDSSTPLALVADQNDLGSTFESLTGSVDFRIYTYGAFNFTRSTERGRIDDIEMRGVTSVIPEPATLGMLVVASGFLLLVRRIFIV